MIERVGIWNSLHIYESRDAKCHATCDMLYVVCEFPFEYCFKLLATMNSSSRESASDLLRKALYALESQNEGGRREGDSDGERQDGIPHDQYGTAGSDSYFRTGWSSPVMHPVSPYMTPTSLPMVSAGMTGSNSLHAAVAAGVRSAPAQLMVYGQQRPPFIAAARRTAYLEQRRLFNAGTGCGQSLH